MVSIIVGSCQKSLNKNVYIEPKTSNKEYGLLVHKTSDCIIIKDGVVAKDTVNLYWENDYYRDGVPLRYCAKCLTDNEINMLQEHRAHQKIIYEKNHPEVELAVKPANEN